MRTKEDRIEYYKSRLANSKENYSRCKAYFQEKGMPDAESDEEIYCGYFKAMIEYWRDRLEKEQTQ